MKNVFGEIKFGENLNSYTDIANGNCMNCKMFGE